MRRETQLLATAAAVTVVVAGAALAEIQGTASTPVSDGGITPYIIAGDNPGGIRTCAEVGTAFFGDANYYQFSSCRADWNGSFACKDQQTFPPDGVSVQVTENKSVSFQSAHHGIGAVIVKGGDAANVYVYDPQQNSDSGLASPPNASGKPAGLSNLTFCWNPDAQEACYDDETAWAAGTRYVSRGNWATYTSYAGTEKTVTLYAGQTMEAATVKLEPANGNVKITITLNAGWIFDNSTLDKENVKIQPYTATPPASNPAPGLFANKYIAPSSPFSVAIPATNHLGTPYKFFGIHADLLREVPCAQ